MLVSAAWLGPAILGGLDVVAQHRIWGEGPVDIRRVLFVSLDWLLYALLTPFVFLLAKRWPISKPHVARHAALHALFSLLNTTCPRRTSPFLISASTAST